MHVLKSPSTRFATRFAAGLAALTLSAAAFAADPQVSLKTSMGEIVLELNQEKAPVTVDNFLKYVKAGFYKGTVFHRVISDFMIQGGGLDAQLHGRKTNKPIKNESNNGLSNEKYTVAMARESNPDSATSQFFINVVDNPGLDYPNMQGSGYTVFGKVVKGQDVVEKIRNVVVDDIHGLENVPVTPVTIQSATLLKGDKVWRGRPASDAHCTIVHLRFSTKPAAARYGFLERPTDRKRNDHRTHDHQQGQHQGRTGRREGTEDRCQLPGLREQGSLHEHDLPSRDQGLHDPGRRFRAGHEAKADRADRRERSEERPQERQVHDRDGPHDGAALGVGPVLHQHEEQRLPELPGPGRLGLCRVRQGRRRPGHRRPDQHRQDEPCRHALRRAERRRRHRESRSRPASHPRTAEAFFRFLAERAAHAERLYLLGDIFEYWAGDDDLDDPFNRTVVDALRRVSAGGTAVYWLAGNRDFLAGAAFAQAAGLTLLPEPHVATIGGRAIILVHGDAQCTDDVKYMAFRAQVRDPAWQRQFLAMPLAQRKAIIAGLREGSRAAHAEKSYELMDVAPAAVAALHADHGADVIIHGHTHRPALHEADGRQRYVLPDWELDDEPVRGGWIAIDADGRILRVGLDGLDGHTI
ncbi:hypothetical protein Lal_00014811 [Lupinus albus]|nr:hypothetical protein Lal_00014811 [Lupinus albus]